MTLLLMLLWSIFALGLVAGALYWSWRIWRACRGVARWPGRHDV